MPGLVSIGQYFLKPLLGIIDFGNMIVHSVITILIYIIFNDFIFNNLT